MQNLEAIRANRNLIDTIDWEMTPEDAVTTYLEWGNNPALGKNVIRSKRDQSVYFVINTWHEPVIYLIRRNSEGAEELAKIVIPEALKERYLEANGSLKGVYPVDGEIKTWLKGQLDNA